MKKNMKYLLNAHLDLLKRIQDVQFRQTNSRITINQRCVSQNWQIQPSTPPHSLRGHSNFSSACLQQPPNFLVQFRWERSVTNSSCVSFHHSDDFADSLWWQTQASEHSTDTAVGACHVGISAEINVQHGSVGSFH